MKVEAQVTALKSYAKCVISSVNNKIESSFERLRKMSSTENKAFHSILESVSYQKLINESNDSVNELESAHRSPNKMNSSKSPSSPNLLNRTPNHHRDVITNTSGTNKHSGVTIKNIPEDEV